MLILSLYIRQIVGSHERSIFIDELLPHLRDERLVGDIREGEVTILSREDHILDEIYIASSIEDCVSLGVDIFQISKYDSSVFSDTRSECETIRLELLDFGLFDLDVETRLYDRLSSHSDRLSEDSECLFE